MPDIFDTLTVEDQVATPGMVEPGNIDLTTRPRVRNSDGSISTVRSIGVNIDGTETLLPTVSDDGRIMSNEEAIQNYHRSGKHLGKFSSVGASNAFAKQLHDQQAQSLADDKVSGDVFDQAAARMQPRRDIFDEAAEQIGTEQPDQATAKWLQQQNAPEKQGFFNQLGKSFVEPIKATARGPAVVALSDDRLKQVLSNAFEMSQAREEPEPTTAGKAGQIVGGLAGTIVQAAPIGARFGLPGIMAQFASAGAYEAFMRAGQRALAEGKDIDEALSIAKKAGSIGAIAQGAAAAIMGGGATLTRQSLRGALGMGGAQAVENVGERALGLKTPAMEGVPEAVVTGGLIPPGMHYLGVAARKALRGVRRAQPADVFDQAQPEAAGEEQPVNEKGSEDRQRMLDLSARFRDLDEKITRAKQSGNSDLAQQLKVRRNSLVAENIALMKELGISPEERTAYASGVTSSEVVPQSEVRPPVGQTPPLRQPGEVTGAGGEFALAPRSQQGAEEVAQRASDDLADKERAGLIEKKMADAIRKKNNLPPPTLIVETQAKLTPEATAARAEVDRVIKLPDDETLKLAQSKQLQGEGAKAGLELSAEDVPALAEQASHFEQTALAAIKVQDQKAFTIASTKALWLRGVIEGARKKGANYEGVLAGELKPKEALTPPAKASQGEVSNLPGGIGKAEGTGGVPAPKAPIPKPVTVTEKQQELPTFAAAETVVHTDPATKVGREVKFLYWNADGTAAVTEPGGRKLKVPASELSAKPAEKQRVNRGVSFREMLNRETTAMGASDIMDWIADQMPMLSKSAALKKWGKEKFKQNASEWDDAPAKLEAIHHNAIYGGNSSPNQVAQAAFEAGLLKEPSATALWQAIGRASKQRVAHKEVRAREATALQNEIEQHQEWASATKKTAGKIEVTTEELAPGDVLEVHGERVKVTARDDDGTLTLEDGRRFGVQKLAEGQHLYVEKLEAASEGSTEFLPEEKPPLELAKPESVEEQKARLAAEAESAQKKAQAEKLAELAAKPLVGKQGDIGQGDLLGGGDLLSMPAKAAQPRSGVLASVEAAMTPEERAELEALTKDLKDKLGRTLTGVDPTYITTGGRIGLLYAKAGMRKFRDFAAAMIEKFGEKAKPFLLSWYNNARTALGGGGFDDESIAQKIYDTEINANAATGSVGAAGTHGGTEGGRAVAQTSGSEGGGRSPVARVVRRELIPGPKPYVGTASYAAKSGFTLSDDQALGINQALSHFVDRQGPAFMLADGTGFGKSAQLLAVADQFRKANPEAKVLYVTQNQQMIKGTVTKDSGRMGIDLRGMTLTTYTKLHTLADRVWDLIIYDEAQNLKNGDARKSMAAGRLEAKHKLFATATPMDRPSGAAYFLAEITGKDEMTVANQLGYTFQGRIDPVTQKPYQVAVLLPKMNWAKVWANITAFRDAAIQAGAMLRREYPFYGDIGVKSLPMEFDAKMEHERIARHYDRLIERSVSPTARRNYAGQKTLTLRRWSEQQKIEPAFEQAMAHLKEGGQVIVMAETDKDQSFPQPIPGGVEGTSDKGFPVWRVPGAIAKLTKLFEDAGVKVAHIHDTTTYDVASEVDKFQKGEAPVALATPASGGAGINLDDVVGDKPRLMLVLSKNLAGDAWDQVIGRVSRKTTQSAAKVDVYHMPEAFGDQRGDDILQQKVKTLRAIQGGEDLDTAGGFETGEPPTGTDAALQEVKSAWNDLKKMGIGPQEDLQRQFRLYTALYNLAKAYVAKGVKSLAEFAGHVGQGVNAIMRRAWDDASAGVAPLTDASKLPKLTEDERAAAFPERTTTQVLGAEMKIGGRPGSSAQADVASINHQHEILRDSGFTHVTRPADRGLVAFEPDGFLYEAEGHRLIKRLQEELPRNWDVESAETPYPLTALFNSIAHAWQDGSLKEVVDEPIARKLFTMTQSVVSHWGLMLQSRQRFGTALEEIAKDPLVQLRYEWSKSYGGANIDSFFERVMSDLTERLGPAAAELLRGNPDMRELLEATLRANMQDSGSRVYRRVQQLFKPKSAKRLEQLLGDSRFMEAVQEVIEQLHQQGVEPKPRPGKKALTPKEQLQYLAQPKIADKVDAAIRGAVRQAERKAGRASFMRENHLTEDDMMAYDDRTAKADAEGPDPTPEQIDQGFATAEFAHWGRFRENLADYSPVTLDLAQRVIQGDFRGVRFKDAPPRAEDLRIDMRKLAVSPDTEVRRVFDAWHDALEGELTNATDETRQRVRQMMEREMAQQLAARRTEVLDSFFNPKAFPRRTASERLNRLLNAGVERDVRFQSEPVRKLVQSLTKIPASEFDEQAVRTRDEKNGWVQDRLIETSNREGWDKMDERTREYFEAVTFTKLAEGLQAAEERLTRQFLGGKDVSYEAKPVKTLAEREASRDAVADKLRGLINAGAFDTSMIERVADKSAVSKLLPTMADLIQKTLETPFYQQAEVKTRFVDDLVNKLGIDPAQAEKAWTVFERAFASKFAEAKARAAEKAFKSITPQEETVIKGRGLTRKILDNINAGNLDGGPVLEAIATAKGERVPPMADVEELKRLGERLQRLQKLGADELAELQRFNATPAEIAKAQEAKANKTLTQQATIKRDMATIWASMWKPLTLRSFTSQQGLINVRDAARDYVVLNLLSKIGHVTRFPIHLATQVATHFGSRPLAVAFEAAGRQGNTLPTWEAIAKAYRLEWEGFKGGLRPAVVGGRAEALGRGEGRNVDALMHSMNTFGRIDRQAEKYWAEGNYPMWLVSRILGVPEYAGKWISVVDQWQGAPAVYADILHQAEIEMVKAGWNPAERVRFQGELVKAMKYEIQQAILESGAVLKSSGEEVTPRQIEENAWGLVKYRLQEMATNRGLPGAGMAETTEALRRQLAWQDEVRRGVGGVIGKGVGLMGKVFPPLGAFGNAIGHGINWTVAKLPPGLHYLADINLIGKEGREPSNFFRTSLDKKQRLIESIGVTMAGGLLAGLILNRMARFNPFISTAQERAEMEKEGRKPGTIDFVLPDGRVSTWSLIVGPMTLFAPWIASFGAWSNLQQRREHAQAALDAKAAREGLPAGKIRDISVADWAGVGVHAAVASILGSKTAGGWTTQFVDPNQGFAAKRTLAGQIAPFVPGLPGWQEVSRMMGVSMRQAQATVWDYLVPMPGSAARAVNALGDPIGTRNGVERVVQVLTGGSYPIPHVPQNRDEEAYQALANSGYQLPTVSPNRGFNVNGEYRPLNDSELTRYVGQRGQLLKAALANLGPNATREQVQAAFQEANQTALDGIGAKAVRQTGVTTPSATGATPRLTGRASRLSRVGRTTGRRSQTLRGAGVARRAGRLSGRLGLRFRANRRGVA